MTEQGKSVVSRRADRLDRHPLLFSLLVFSVLSVIFFGQVFTGGFIVRDIYHEFYPQKMLWGWAGNGQLALWNPYTSMGVPVSGAVFHAIWHPANVVLFYLLPLAADVGLKIYVLLHFALAGFCMFYLMRRMGVANAGAAAGALVYTFAGYPVSQHYAVNMLGGIAFFPLALGLMLKARAEGGTIWCVMAGAVTGLIFLAGDPQSFALTVAAAVLFFLVIGESEAGPVRLALGIAVFLLASVGAAAVELIPMARVLAGSMRGQGFSYDIAAAWSFNPLRVIEFFLSMPLGSPWPTNEYWGNFLGERYFAFPLCVSPYVGMWTAIAGVAAFRKTRGRALRTALVLSALLVFFLLLSFGRFFPLHRFFFDHLPGMSSLRYPEKYLFMVSFCLACLAGLGTGRLVSESGQGALALRSLAGGRAGAVLFHPALVLAGTAAIGLLSRVFFGRLCGLLAPLLETGGAVLRVSPEMAAHLLVSSVTRSGFFLALCLLVYRSLQTSPNKWIAYAPALLLFLDLSRANRGLAPAAPGLYRMESYLGALIMDREGGPQCGAAGTPGRQEIPSCCAQSPYRPCVIPGGFRIFRDNSIIPPDTVMPEKTDKIVVEDAELRRWQRDTLKPNLGMIDGFEDFSGLNVATPFRFDWMFTRVVTFYDLPIYNVKYAIIGADRAPAKSDAISVVKEYEGVVLVEFKNVLPRSYWVGEGIVARSKSAVSSIFNAADLRKSVIVQPAPGEDGGWLYGKGSAGHDLVPAQIESYTPNRVVIRADAPAAGWLVLSDSYFPGWTATVDGEPAPIAVANGIGRAVRVGGGGHEVIFNFRPRGLTPGLVISGAFWVMVLVLLARLKWWARHSCRVILRGTSRPDTPVG